MLKKILTTASILMTFSTLTTFSEQNYTLQTNEAYNPLNKGAFTKNSPRHADGFCNAFGMGFSDIIEQSSYSAGKRTSSRTLPSRIALSSFDPYMIEIDGIKYMLVRDNQDGILDKDDILGYKDSVSNVFASLKPLDTNYDNKLTGAELTAGRIRLVQLSKNGKLMFSDKKSDFKNENIVFIYISGLRKAYTNNGAVGKFGYFDTLIKNQDGSTKLVTGIVTFESESQLNNYF